MKIGDKVKIHPTYACYHPSVAGKPLEIIGFSKPHGTVADVRDDKGSTRGIYVTRLAPWEPPRFAIGAVVRVVVEQGTKVGSEIVVSGMLGTEHEVLDVSERPSGFWYRIGGDYWLAHESWLGLAQTPEARPIQPTDLLPLVGQRVEVTGVDTPRAGTLRSVQVYAEEWYFSVDDEQYLGSKTSDVAARQLRDRTPVDDYATAIGLIGKWVDTGSGEGVCKVKKVVVTDGGTFTLVGEYAHLGDEAELPGPASLWVLGQ